MQAKEPKPSNGKGRKGGEGAEGKPREGSQGKPREGSPGEEPKPRKGKPRECKEAQGRPNVQSLKIVGKPESVWQRSGKSLETVLAESCKKVRTGTIKKEKLG